jgi:hypothetical protein
MATVSRLSSSLRSLADYVFSFNRDSAPGRSSTRVDLPNPTQLLEKMHRRQISPLLVVAESVFDSHHEATEAIKTFSQAAVNLNIPEIIAEIGEAQAFVVSEDALKDVPEVMPVIRSAVSWICCIRLKLVLISRAA